MSKVRLQISLEDTLLNSLDSYCKKNYINRSAALSFMATQFLMQHQVIDSLNTNRRYFNETTAGISD